jgi:3-oxoacyl-[acyl-carrier-protein] synthase-3
MLDKTDRNTGPLFGDGAAAVLLQPRPEFRKHRWHAGSDGAGADLMRGQIGKGIALDGIRVYHRAVRTMTETAKILRENDVEPSIVIGHQANSRILQRVRDEADIGSAVFVDCVENFGNTSAASIPLALDEAVRDGRIKPGQHVLLEGVGGGFTWGAVLIKW